nr:MAG TPA: hypothetical protein [Caudoviricetes sp.]
MHLLWGDHPGGLTGLPALRAAMARILTCTKPSRTFDLHESKSEL